MSAQPKPISPAPERPAARKWPRFVPAALARLSPPKPPRLLPKLHRVSEAGVKPGS